MMLKRMLFCFTLAISLSMPSTANAAWWNDVGNWFEDRWNDTVEFFEDAVDETVEFFEDVVEKTVDFFEYIGEATANLVVKAVDFFVGLGSNVASAYKDVRDDVSQWFTTNNGNSPKSATSITVSDFDLTSTDALLQSEFIARRDAYIDATGTENNLVLDAYMGVPISEERIAAKMETLLEDKNPDFTLIELIRIINFTDAYDDQILPVISQLPYWLPEDDGTRVYTSENHMIMWMSAQWLLEQKTGVIQSDELRTRLKHWLELKRDYGYYEFFSLTYLPYSLGGIINLVDFAEDEEIKELARQAALVLLHDLVLATNSQGIFMPVSGRAYPGKYRGKSYGSTTQRIAAILTGVGPKALPGGNGPVPAFATTSLDVSPVLAAYSENVNVSYRIGHSSSESAVDTLHGHLNEDDKAIFQMSAGAYAHPNFVADTLALTAKYNINSKLADDFAQIIASLEDILSLGSSIGGSLTKSSLLMDQTIDIYKDGSAMLSSVQSYNGGRAGWQQFPWMATTGTQAIFTSSGEGRGGWDVGQQMANTHLPDVKQNGNVALITYKADTNLHLISRAVDLFVNNGIEFDTKVNLYWPDENFDETASYGNWIFAREGDGYIAVYRHCTDTESITETKDGQDVVNVFYSCDDREQVWASVAGSAASYNSFSNFISVVSQAEIQSEWNWSWSKFKHVWQTTLNVDGVRISKDWTANPDDLTDSQMWELADVVSTDGLSTVSISANSLDNVQEDWVQAGSDNCETGFLFHQLASYEGTDTAITRTNTNNGCQVKVQEEQSLDDEIDHVEETIDFIRFNSDRFIGGEAGQISLDHEWQTIELQFSYDDPVVLSSLVSHVGDDPFTIEIQNITSNSFEIRIAEFEYLDGPHHYETVNYVVMNAGKYNLNDGRVLEVGSAVITTDIDESPEFQTVRVGLSNYQLITQIQGTNSDQVLITRIDNKDTGRFDMTLTSQESDRANLGEVSAVVGYMLVGEPFNLTYDAVEISHIYTSYCLAGCGNLLDVTVGDLGINITRHSDGKNLKHKPDHEPYFAPGLGTWGTWYLEDDNYDGIYELRSFETGQCLIYDGTALTSEVCHSGSEVWQFD